MVAWGEEKVLEGDKRKWEQKNGGGGKEGRNGGTTAMVTCTAHTRYPHARASPDSVHEILNATQYLYQDLVKISKIIHIYWL